MDTKLLLTALISGVVAATLTWFLAGSATETPKPPDASLETRRDAAAESLAPLLQAVAEGLDGLRQELRATRDPAFLPPANQRVSAHARAANMRLIEDELRRRHMLWTMRDLVARYGVPDRMGVMDGVVLWICKHGKEGDDVEMTL